MINGKTFEKMQKIRKQLNKVDGNDSGSLYADSNGLTLYSRFGVAYVPEDENSVCTASDVYSYMPCGGAIETIDIDVETLKALLPLFSGTVRIELRNCDAAAERRRRLVIYALNTDRTQAVVQPVFADSRED